MEFVVLEKKKQKMQVQLLGLDHTLCNLLVSELHEDKQVLNAAYAIDHPLVGKPKLILETADKDPQVVLADALKRCKKNLTELKK
jgi:DNA-directed RNA polymerase subunit L